MVISGVVIIKEVCILRRRWLYCDPHPHMYFNGIKLINAPENDIFHIGLPVYCISSNTSVMGLLI